jgi:glycerol-3-phosphate acyltransferase PlsY
MDFLTSPSFITGVALLLAYAMGSVSFAVLISRVMKLPDPREYGSGNPGATNVLRSGNRTAAILTLLADALKGFIPVLLARLLGAPLNWHDESNGIIACVGLAAFIGHLWPIFFRFKGGKGVATAVGVLLAFNPILGLACIATWLIVAFFFRYSSLAAIISAIFAPFYQTLIWGPGPETLVLIVMSGLLIWRHGSNINKLIKGTESRIGAAKAASYPHTSPIHTLKKENHD